MAISDQELLNQRKFTLTAGISLIIMALAASFSYGFAHRSLVVKGDASTTFINIMASSGLFKAEILGWLIILICDIVAAWAIYLFMKPLNKNLSLLGAWLRLSYATILGIAITNLIYVLLLTTDSQYSSIWTINQLQANMMLSLQAFESIWSIGLIIFGGHLLIIAIVALQSDQIPRIISILILIAAIGYLVVHLSSSFFNQYDEIISLIEMIFIVPMTVGELGFGLWLLFRGGMNRT